MKVFMNEEFLLDNKTAEKLYHNYAEDMPIIDYHCHLDAEEIAKNKKYKNITEIWLGGDHYKWRALRANGIDEKYITGDADDKEKFLKWAETIPYCIGNPLYHWTHLELKRFFDIDLIISPDTAEEIWERCNKMLARDDFSVKSLIKKSNVVQICTTDDPADSLEHHIQIANDNIFNVKVLPAMRPDNCINIEKDSFNDYIKKLGTAADIEIISFKNMKSALRLRIDFFHKNDCRLSDHALEPPVFEISTEKEIELIFSKRLKNQKLNELEIDQYKTAVLLFLGKTYDKLGWVMQIHIGTIRDNNKKMFNLLGPNTGFDAACDYNFAKPLTQFLSALDEYDNLPKTILYCLNPGDNEVLASISGCFSQSGVPGKMQVGSAWWFNDHIDGMKKQMKSLANIGLLSRFVGMLTDSRSFLSYTRHEYFRRILCNLIGEWAEVGQIPNDMKLLGKMVQDICYYNAEKYFK